MVEHAAHNGLVVGSSPTRPKNIDFPINKMDYNLKKYQILKIKNFFKNTNFLFIYHSSKLNSKEWIQTEQKLKKLKMEHYKIYNGTSIRIIKRSIYKHYSNIISSLILLIKPKFKSTEIKLLELKKKLKMQFVLLIIKFNNKIYMVSQVEDIKTFSYKKEVFNFYKVLEKSTKTSVYLKKQFETM